MKISTKNNIIGIATIAFCIFLLYLALSYFIGFDNSLKAFTMLGVFSGIGTGLVLVLVWAMNKID